MTEEPMAENSRWKKFLRRHWSIVLVFVVAAALIFIGAIYVFLWFAGQAQSTGLVPRTLGLWSLGNLVSFIVYAILWELLLVALPVVIAAVAFWQGWWKRLPDEERGEYRFFRKRSRTTRGGGGVSLFFFIAFCIKVSLDGNWSAPIATYTLDYVVYSMLTILVWTLVILGIPIAIGLTWWIRREMKKHP
jgi:hypothetical protein